MPKQKKTRREKVECGCCGARMEVAEELAPQPDGKRFCKNCGPKAAKTPDGAKCER